MSDGTKIEWTEATWNPISGCTKVSEGCENCYIERTPPFRMEGRRFDLPVIGGTTGVRLHPDRLGQPLTWRKPRKVFVNSLADLFHEDVPDAYIARVFATMAASPTHTFQVLTKRHARMRSLLTDSGFKFRDAVWHELCELIGDYAAAVRFPDTEMTWPLPNVWLGVSVESQKWADWRIPALLDTPAAVRWLSCEPLLSSVDLSRWIGGSKRSDGPGAGRTGGALGGRAGARLADAGDDAGLNSGWPGTSVHPAACGCRTVAQGRVLASAGDDADGASRSACASHRVDGGQPAHDSSGAGDQPQERDQGRQPTREPGARHTVRERSACAPLARALQVDSGREAHAGTGAGDSTTARGELDLQSGVGERTGREHQHSKEDRNTPDVGMAESPGRIDWVVVGGESGPGARPMHPDWARALRDQCTAAGVPFLFKQWGQWTSAPQLEVPNGFVGPDGEWGRRQPRSARPDRWYPVWRVGKGKAGRVLDGRTWDEYPAVASVGADT